MLNSTKALEKEFQNNELKALIVQSHREGVALNPCTMELVSTGGHVLLPWACVICEKEFVRTFSSTLFLTSEGHLKRPDGTLVPVGNDETITHQELADLIRRADSCLNYRDIPARPQNWPRSIIVTWSAY